MKIFRHKQEEIISVDVHESNVEITVPASMIRCVRHGNDFHFCLSRKETTDFIRALKAQRKRKNVK